MIHGGHHVAQKLVTYKVSFSFLPSRVEASSGLISTRLKGTTASVEPADSFAITESVVTSSVVSVTFDSLLQAESAANNATPNTNLFILFLLFLNS